MNEKEKTKRRTIADKVVIISIHHNGSVGKVVKVLKLSTFIKDTELNAPQVFELLKNNELKIGKFGAVKLSDVILQTYGGDCNHAQLYEI